MPVKHNVMIEPFFFNYFALNDFAIGLYREMLDCHNCEGNFKYVCIDLPVL